MDVVDSRKFKKILIEKSLSLRSLSQSSHVHPCILSKISKKDSKIQIRTVGKICNALGCKAEDLLKED